MAALGLKGRKVTVVGADASGLALVRFLVRRSAVVTLVDSRPSDVLMPLLGEEIDLSRFQLEAGDYVPKTFEESQLVVVTPSIPMDLKILELARTVGVPVMSELDFVASHVEEPLIAVGGTNGKSTTAFLLANILENSGKNVFVNVGHPLAEYLNRPKPADYVIATASALQLEGIVNLNPAMILMLNLSEDMANRYPNFESYLSANREIFKNVNEQTKIVFNALDPQVSALVPSLPGQKFLFGGSGAYPEDLSASWGDKNNVVLRMAGTSPSNFTVKNFRLRGVHNRENLMAAALAATLLGAKGDDIQKTIDSVSALPHRVEFVRRINSVAFYNDSCAANTQAVLRTLQAFHEPIILISGGRDKNTDYSPLIPHIRQKVKNLILVGEAKEKFNRAVGDFTETFLVGTMEEAVLVAYQKSRSGDVILLSPGCDSSDMFVSDEDRGEHFKRLVTQIAQPRRPNVI